MEQFGIIDSIKYIKPYVKEIEESKLHAVLELLKKEKGFDYLVANPLETMGSDASDFYIFTPRGEIELKGVSKEELASRLFGLIGA